jgi:hypothetical protein
VSLSAIVVIDEQAPSVLAITPATAILNKPFIIASFVSLFV